MSSTAIKCPQCGGEKVITAGPDEFMCLYCGTKFVSTGHTPPPPVVSVTCCPYCGGEIPIGAQKCRHCGEWLVHPMQPAAPAQPVYVQNGQQQITTSKSKVTAALLAFFFGGFGVHEFYLGKNGAGVAFLIIFCLTFWMVWPAVIIAIICTLQAIGYLCMSDQAFAEKYH